MIFSGMFWLCHGHQFFYDGGHWDTVTGKTSHLRLKIEYVHL